MSDLGSGAGAEVDDTVVLETISCSCAIGDAATCAGGWGFVGSFWSVAGAIDWTFVIIGVVVVLFPTAGVTVLAVIVIPGIFGKVIAPPLVEVMVIILGGFGTSVVAGGAVGASGGSCATL